MYFFAKNIVISGNVKKILFPLLLLFGAILLGSYIGSRNVVDMILGDRLAGLNIDLTNPQVLFLVIRRVFILAMVGGVSLFIGKALYKWEIDELICGFICFLPLLMHLSPRFPFHYEDTAGNITDINLTGLFLVVIFFMIVIKRWSWFVYAINNSIVQALCLIFIFGLLTQVYYLGLFMGGLVVFARVIQPILFIILTSYLSRSRSGLMKSFVFVVASILIAIAYGIITENAGVTETDADGRRLGVIGSWTIYATILVSTIPMIFCLMGRSKWSEKKLFLLTLIPLVIRETILTQTRSAIVAIAALFIFVLDKKYRILLFVIFILLAYTYTIGDLKPIEFSGGRFLDLDITKVVQDNNWGVRVARNAAAVQYIIDYPIQGLGLGRPTVETGPQLAFWTYNTYLAWGIAFGIPAMLAFGFLMVKSFIDAIFNYLREKSNTRIFQLGLLISLIIWTLNQFTTGDSLTYLQPIESTFYFYAIIGMIMGQKYMLDHDYIPEKILLNLSTVQMASTQITKEIND